MKTDLQNFEEIYEKFFQRFFAFFVYRVKTREDAEDLNAVLWERILENLSKIGDQPGQFEAWSFRTARNLVIDFYRSQEKYKGQTSIDESFSVKDNLDIEQNHKMEQDLQQLFDLVEKLPKTQQEAFRLRYFDGLKNKEIAEILGVSETTVAANLTRATKYLKEIFIKCSNYLAIFVLLVITP